MEIIKGDLLAIEHGVICHQVNCKGVMGAGLALKIKSKYPQCFSSYSKYCRDGTFKLGMIQFCKINPSLFICNLAGQSKYGKGCQTDYDALATCLIKLHSKSISMDLIPYLPFKLGCGLGGGDWTLVSSLIELHCPNAVIVQL